MRKNAYPIVKPEDVSVSSDAICSTIADIREKHGLELHSFLMLRRGSLVWEEYFRDGEVERLHDVFSVSKSFTSTAIGLAQSQGLLSLDDKLYDFFPEHAGLCDSEANRMITLRHLLTMSSGFENNESKIFSNLIAGDLLTFALSQPVIHEPGTVFNYYTLGTYLLSAAFSRIRPEGIHEYLKDNLFKMMGFGRSHWNICNQGVPFGGFGFHLTAYDLTRLGQLYLQEGVWEGQQLLPKSYVREATAKHIDQNYPVGVQDWNVGYGYHFWHNVMGGYRAAGHTGQYIIVLPEKETVIVMTSHLEDMLIPTAAIATHLLPEIK